MPWHIEPRGDQFCVVKDADGSDEGCHPTRAEAADQMAALYANEPAATIDELVVLAAAIEVGGEAFSVFLAPEGFESGDGRLLELGTTTWRDPPLPLMMQDTASHGAGNPDAAWFAGAIEEVYRDPADPSRILGRGHLVPGPEGERAAGLIRGGLRGLSIDGIGGMERPPIEQITAVDGDGRPIRALVRYGDTRIMGAAVVPHPAFEPCCIWLAGEEAPGRVGATHGAEIALDTPPEVVTSPLEALLASAGGPLRPPTDWFYADEPGHYQPLEVRGDGFISGHIARWGTCHIGQVGRCETAPRSATSYRYFHRTLAETESGTLVPCGWLTMGTSHQRNLTASADETLNHYDHTGYQAAKVRAIDGAFGIWVCGAVRPGLSDEQLWALQGPEVSGDWRSVDGHYRELVAVLGVTLPGFLTQRPEALVASGAIVAQIGTLPCDDCAEPSIEPASDAEVRHLVESGLIMRIVALERQLSLLRPAVLDAARARVEAYRPDERLAHYRTLMRL